LRATRVEDHGAGPSLIRRARAALRLPTGFRRRGNACQAVTAAIADRPRPTASTCSTRASDARAAGLFIAAVIA
jgi:hypothetical protein